MLSEKIDTKPKQIKTQTKTKKLEIGYFQLENAIISHIQSDMIYVANQIHRKCL